MGTISEKLTYLNETKNKLKNVINYSGTNITNDTFRSYPEKLYDKFVDFVTNGMDSLYNSLPKVIGENTELTLNNTANGVLKLDFKGNTSHNSTSGKNLLNVNYDSYTFDTSHTSQQSIGNLNLTAGITYYISYTIENATTSNTRNTPYLQLSSSSTKIYESSSANYNLTAGRKVWQYTPSESGIYIFGYWGHLPSVDLTISNFMISTSNDTTYEPYTNGPSPNSDYPQQIHVVTGDNDVKIENKNLAQHIDGYLSSPGVFKTASDDSFYFPVIQGETYIYNSSGNRTRTAIFDSIPTNNQTCIANTYLTINTNTPFVASATGYMVIFANTPTSETVKNDFIAVKGNTIGNYTTHQEQTYRVDFGGKNKVDFNNASYVAANYATVTKNGELYTVENGSSNSGSVRFENIDLLLKPNTTYTVSALIVSTTAINGSCVYVSPGLRVEGTSVFGNRVGAGERSYVTFTTPNTLSTGNIALTPREANTTAVFTDIMIEEGTEATRYSRYVENPIEMCEIGEYEDKLFKNTTDNPLYNADLELNKWYKYGAVGKVVLDGSETWLKSSNTNVDRYALSTNLYLRDASSLCNYFTRGASSNYNPGIWYNNNNVQLLFNFATYGTTTVEDWKTWLSTHNLILYQPLATPEYTLLDDTLQKQLDEIYYNAVSYEDQTNISQTNADLPFVFSASAIKNYESLEV